IAQFVLEAVTGQPSPVDTTQVLEQFMLVLENCQPSAVASPVSEDAGLVGAGLTDTLEHITPNITKPAPSPPSPPPQLADSYIDDDELRQVYQLTSGERLHSLETGLHDLTQNPDNQAIWEELRREVHSLKGDSRSVGVETVEILAHPLEEIIETCKSHSTAFTPEINQILHQGVEAIATLVQEAITGQPTAVDTTEVLEQLMLVLEHCQES
ncbi:MAG: Hpt domain-containing protein, partial [Coleofasciculus sp. C2-GNP5-27]